MPGRPKMMVKKFAKLEERALALQRDVWRLAPDQYLKQEDCGADPLGLGQAWRDAWSAARNTYCVLSTLGDILHDKAGINRWDAPEYAECAPDDEEDWEPGDEFDTPVPSDTEHRNPG